MLSMNEIVDLRMQQQIAHEIYRQQIMQRIPDPFPTLLPLPGLPHHMLMPPRPTLPPGVEAKLENNDLWQQFHKIGTEMIITKSGRRMFPSMRVSVSGLEEESNYCVLLEMVPIGDCRFKFSGSQWVPAGGAEPQSPQRMFLHPDSPATGAHWQSQAILFNKVKLTNNTLDSSGHIVLASMHKYQPRLHFIRTNDLTQLPWAPQQAFVFPETEFVAVTAYQNDRITKLKIDNNPFAKGFRETGQSRCKRKINATVCLSGSDGGSGEEHASNSTLSLSDDEHATPNAQQQQHEHEQSAKRLMRSNGSLDDEGCFSSNSSTSSSSHSIGSISPRIDEYAALPATHHFYAHHHHSNHHHQHHQYHHMQHPHQHQHPIHHSAMLRSMDLAAAAAAAYFVPQHEVNGGGVGVNGNGSSSYQHLAALTHAAHPAATALAAAALVQQQQQQHPNHHQHHHSHMATPYAHGAVNVRCDYIADGDDDNEEETEIDVASRSPSPPVAPTPPSAQTLPALVVAASSNTTSQQQQQQQPSPTQTKRNSFSISAILAY